MADGERGVRERGRVRKQQLLDATIDVIHERGMSGVTHRAVAARAGVPASSTTYFFSSLDDLIGEAVESMMVAEIARISELEEAVDSDRLTRDETIDRFVELVRRQPERDVTAQFEVYLFASHHPRLQHYVTGIRDAMHRVSTAVLASRGVLDPHAGAALIALVDGFALHRIASAGAENYAALHRALHAIVNGFLALEAEESGQQED